MTTAQLAAAIQCGVRQTAARTMPSPWHRQRSCPPGTCRFPPYALGAWLGGGTTKPPPDGSGRLRAGLRGLGGALDGKHIPGGLSARV